MDPRIKDKIRHLVNHMQITDINQLRNHIANFVISLPESVSTSNQRFYPKSKTIQNAVSRCLAESRLVLETLLLTVQQCMFSSYVTLLLRVQ